MVQPLFNTCYLRFNVSVVLLAFSKALLFISFFLLEFLDITEGGLNRKNLGRRPPPE